MKNILICLLSGESLSSRQTKEGNPSKVNGRPTQLVVGCQEKIRLDILGPKNIHTTDYEHLARPPGHCERLLCNLMTFLENTGKNSY